MGTQARPCGSAHALRSGVCVCARACRVTCLNRWLSAQLPDVCSGHVPLLGSSAHMPLLLFRDHVMVSYVLLSMTTCLYMLSLPP